VKRSIPKVLIISLAFFSLLSHGDEYSDKVTQFKISSLQLFSSFSSFIYFQGDNRNRIRLMNAKNLGDQAISELPDSEVALKLKWKQVSDYVNDYQAYEFNGADMSLEGGWGLLQGELNVVISDLGLSAPKGISGIQVDLEVILGQYMAFANSTTGGYGVSNNDIPLEDQINTMTQTLIALAQADVKYQPLLRKWNYIRSTLLAYNSNVAPFVVMHTFDSMRTMIAEY
jgi:hypothetical protein